MPRKASSPTTMLTVDRRHGDVSIAPKWCCMGYPPKLRQRQNRGHRTTSRIVHSLAWLQHGTLVPNAWRHRLRSPFIATAGSARRLGTKVPGGAAGIQKRRGYDQEVVTPDPRPTNLDAGLP